MGFSVFDLVAKITLDTVEYNKSLDSAEKYFSGLGEKISGIGKGIMDGLASVGKAVVVGIGAATTAVRGFAAASVKTGATFDTSMAQVAATMGKTVDEIQDLRDYALEMGSKTAFSASQAADALNYMALAGYDSEKSMQMLPNVLNLAAAGAMDLASASDMVTDAQSALGLNMEETTQLVDKMAKASSKSNTSVAQLGSAILTIGGTAKNLSGGTTELAQALGLLADNGIKGAEGGTALRNILLNLTPRSEDAAKAMEQIGLKAYDAEGKMRPLKDIFTDLNKGMEGMTDQEKTNILSNIFNKVDLKSVNALLATNVERWDELSNAIDNASGSAEAMANTQLDNLEGDITLFKSALEGAQIVISDHLTPSLRDFVQFGTEGVSKLSDAFKDGGLSGAMDVFSNLLSEGLNMIISKLPQAVDAGVQLLGAITKGIIDNIPTLGNAAIQIIQMLGQKLIENFPKITSGLKNIGSQIISFITDGFSENQEGIISGIQNLASMLAEYLLSTPERFLAIGQSIINFISDGLGTNPSSLLKSAGEAIENILSAITEKLPDILNGGMEILKNLAQGIFDNLPFLIQKAGEVLNSLINFLFDNAPEFLETAVEFIGQMAQGLINALPDLLNTLGEVINNLLDKLLGSLPEFLNKGMEIIMSLVEGFFEKLPDIIASIVRILLELQKTIREHFPEFLEKGIEIIGKIMAGCLKSIPYVIEAIGSIVGEIINSFLSTDWIQVGKDIINGVIDGIKSLAGSVFDAIKEVAAGANDAAQEEFEINSPSKVFYRFGRFIDEGLAEGIRQNADIAENAIKGLSTNISTPITLDTEISDSRALKNATLAPVSASASNVSGFVQNLTFNSPQALDPSEIARQTRNATRNMILQLRMA